MFFMGHSVGQAENFLIAPLMCTVHSDVYDTLADGSNAGLLALLFA